jgi:hypothetical protein
MVQIPTAYAGGGFWFSQRTSWFRHSQLIPWFRHPYLITQIMIQISAMVQTPTAHIMVRLDNHTPIMIQPPFLLQWTGEGRYSITWNWPVGCMPDPVKGGRNTASWAAYCGPVGRPMAYPAYRLYSKSALLSWPALHTVYYFRWT